MNVFATTCLKKKVLCGILMHNDNIIIIVLKKRFQYLESSSLIQYHVEYAENIFSAIRIKNPCHS